MYSNDTLTEDHKEHHHKTHHHSASQTSRFLLLAIPFLVILTLLTVAFSLYKKDKLAQSYPVESDDAIWEDEDDDEDEDEDVIINEEQIQQYPLEDNSYNRKTYPQEEITEQFPQEPETAIVPGEKEIIMVTIKVTNTQAKLTWPYIKNAPLLSNIYIRRYDLNSPPIPGSTPPTIQSTQSPTTTSWAENLSPGTHYYQFCAKITASNKTICSHPSVAIQQPGNYTVSLTIPNLE